MKIIIPLFLMLGYLAVIDMITLPENKLDFVVAFISYLLGHVAGYELRAAQKG